LIENEKDELFKNSIQVYDQYLKELKQKGKKVAMKIISRVWRSYKSKLVKIWRNHEGGCGRGTMLQSIFHREVYLL
jgi:hypothetical protein